MCSTQKFCIYVLFLLCSSLYSISIRADSITLKNINPTNTDNIIVEVSGCRGAFIGALNISVERNGNNINVTSDVKLGGFFIPGCYNDSVDLGLLLPGAYTISYFVSDRNPNLQQVISVSVAQRIQNIPTLNVYGLIILTLSLLLISKKIFRLSI